MANTALDTIDVATNTFRNWIDKTNEAIEVLRSQAVTVTSTAGGDTVTGNGFVVGILGANTLTATTIRGGTANSSTNLAIITNTNINAAYVNVVANTLIYSNSTVAAAIFGGNSVATNTTFNSTTFTVNSNVAINGTSHTVSGNLSVDSGVLFVDATNNRVGINTSAPNTSVTVNGSVLVTGSLTLAGIQYLANSITLSSTSLAVIDTFPVASYRSGKYLVSITDDTSPATFQASEILVMQDGSSSYLTEYAVVRTGSSLGSFTTDVSGGNARLMFTPTVANSTIKISRTLLGV
jgi:hypothetical protein